MSPDEVHVLDGLVDSTEHIPSGQDVPSEGNLRTCPVSAEANLDDEAPRDEAVASEASIATDDSSDAQASTTVESHVTAEPLGATPTTESQETVDKKIENENAENVVFPARRLNSSERKRGASGFIEVVPSSSSARNTSGLTQLATLSQWRATTCSVFSLSGTYR